MTTSSATCSLVWLRARQGQRDPLAALIDRGIRASEQVCYGSNAPLRYYGWLLWRKAVELHARHGDAARAEELLSTAEARRVREDDLTRLRRDVQTWISEREPE